MGAVVSKGGGSVAGVGITDEVAVSVCKVVVWILSEEGRLNICIGVNTVAGSMRLVDVIDRLRGRVERLD